MHDINSNLAKRKKKERIPPHASTQNMLSEVEIFFIINHPPKRKKEKKEF